MRPARKAREGRVPGVCNRRATPRPGMQRRPNVTETRGRDTRLERSGEFSTRTENGDPGHSLLDSRRFKRRLTGSEVVHRSWR